MNEMLYYGFVQMETLEQAEHAIDRLDGQKLMGRRLRVMISTSDRKGQSLREEGIQVHVSFLSGQVALQVDEQLLDRVFSRLGHVTDCVIKQYSSVVHPRPRQCGYGYVYFADLTVARNVIGLFSSESKREAEGVRFDCKFSRDSEHLLQELSANSAASSSATPTQTASEDLTRIASADHGEIISAVESASSASYDGETSKHSEGNLSPQNSGHSSHPSSTAEANHRQPFVRPALQVNIPPTQHRSQYLHSQDPNQMHQRQQYYYQPQQQLPLQQQYHYPYPQPQQHQQHQQQHHHQRIQLPAPQFQEQQRQNFSNPHFAPNVVPPQSLPQAPSVAHIAPYPAHYPEMHQIAHSAHPQQHPHVPPQPFTVAMMPQHNSQAAQSQHLMMYASNSPNPSPTHAQQSFIINQHQQHSQQQHLHQHHHGASPTAASFAHQPNAAAFYYPAAPHYSSIPSGTVAGHPVATASPRNYPMSYPGQSQQQMYPVSSAPAASSPLHTQPQLQPHPAVQAMQMPTLPQNAYWHPPPNNNNDHGFNNTQ